MKIISDIEKKEKEIFIFRIGNLGDSIVSIPALLTIKNRHPNSKFTLITESYPNKKYVDSWSVLKHLGIFSRVRKYEKKILNIFSLILFLRSHRKAFFYYLAPHRDLKVIKRDKFFFTRLCGIKNIIGFDNLVDPESYIDKFGNFPRQEKESNQLLRLINYSSENKYILKRPYFKPSKKDFEKVKKIIKVDKNKFNFLALGPGSNMISKKWPISRYAELIKRIIDYEKKIYILLFGGKEDILDAEDLTLKTDGSRVTSLCGKTNIIESAAALSLCEFYLGNDTGVMHLASAMGLDCISIFSSRANPGRWEPFGDKNIIHRKDGSHFGCELTDCKICQKELEKITVDEVMNSFKEKYWVIKE